MGWALVVLVSISACDGDKGSPETAAVKAEIEELEDAIKKAREENKQLSADIKEWKSSLKNAEKNAAEAEELKRELAELNAYNERMKSVAREAESHLDVWRNFVRERVVGRELGNILLVDNTPLQGASVVSISEEAVVLKHSGGEATVAFDNLPEEIRLKLFHEPTLDSKAAVSEAQ